MDCQDMLQKSGSTLCSFGRRESSWLGFHKFTFTVRIRKSLHCMCLEAPLSGLLDLAWDMAENPCMIGQETHPDHSPETRRREH